MQNTNSKTNTLKSYWFFRFARISFTNSKNSSALHACFKNGCCNNSLAVARFSGYISFLPNNSYIRIEWTCQVVLKIVTPLFRFENSWRRTRMNEKQCLERSVMIMGRFSISHLQSSDTKRPDVYARIVTTSLDQFWGHPERSANHRFTTFFLWINIETKCDIRSQPYRKTEIRKFHFTLSINKNIITLDIYLSHRSINITSMNSIIMMHAT